MIIYSILNKINGKRYVGQTSRKLDTRIYWHIHSSKNGPTSLIHRAINKYGIQSFEFSVVDVADSKENLNEKEIYWIKNLGTKVPDGYNMKDGGNGGSNNKGISHSEKTIHKMSEAHKGEKNPFFGKRHSIETRAKMSISRRGNKHLLGHKHSQETRQKMSEAQAKRYIPVIPENPEKENGLCQMN